MEVPLAVGPQLDLALPASVSLSDWIGETLGDSLGARGELNDRERIAMGMLSIALDHREAVLLLVSKGARSSAMALMRPIFDSLVSGYWMTACATDQQAQAFMAERHAPSLDTLIRKLQKHDAVGALFGHIKRLHGTLLHDFVHGGPRQVSRWISPAEIGPRHSDLEMVEVLRVVDVLGLFACVVREDLTGRDSQPFLVRLQAMLEPGNPSQ